jgi:hypothetical protein
MADIENPEEPVVISEDDARGAESPEEVSKGDTLVPMLLWGLGLAGVGIVVVLILMNSSH